MSSAVLRFMPPNCCRVELSFFERLYHLKLDEVKLDDRDLPVRAFLSGGGEMMMRFSGESLKEEEGGARWLSTAE